jgi:hypothetical protein
MGLEPLETTTAPDPGVAAGETQNVVDGTTPNYDFGHAHGYVHAPSGVVYATVKDPHVVMTTRRTDKQTFVLNIEPEYEYSFQLSYEVDDLVTVAWDEIWRYGAIKGDVDAPELAIVRYQKVYGTSFITLIEGMILIQRVDDEWTDVQMVEHVKSVGSGPAEIRDTLIDRYRAIVAVSHGGPVPPLMPTN